jgi:hypothetical protein
VKPKRPIAANQMMRWLRGPRIVLPTFVLVGVISLAAVEGGTPSPRRPSAWAPTRSSVAGVHPRLAWAPETLDGESGFYRLTATADEDEHQVYSIALRPCEAPLCDLISKACSRGAPLGASP